VAVVFTRRTAALKTLGWIGLVRTIHIPSAINIGLSLFIFLIVPLAEKKPNLPSLWTVLPVAYLAQLYLVYNASKHWVSPGECVGWPAALFDVAFLRFLPPVDAGCEWRSSPPRPRLSGRQHLRFVA
jgi:hypothetical protein